MFGKSASFIVRSLFVAATIGSLVACSFESATPEGQGQTSAADSKKKSGSSVTSTADASTGCDNGDSDASYNGDNDASVDVDGGPYGEDGGTGDWGNDASAGDWGNSSSDASAGDWGNDGGF